MPIVRKTLEQIRREGGGEINAEAFDAMTDEEIARRVAEDPDAAPLMTDEDLKRARVVRPRETLRRA